MHHVVVRRNSGLLSFGYVLDPLRLTLAGYQSSIVACRACRLALAGSTAI
jgi:hypothetical protein